MTNVIRMSLNSWCLDRVDSNIACTFSYTNFESIVMAVPDKVRDL
jgi:hypothetical protein